MNGSTNPTFTVASNISPYLIEGHDFALPIRRVPLCPVPEIVYGNKPSDGGHLIVEPADFDSILAESPEAAPYLRPLLCAEQYLNNEKRYCLWLPDAPPKLIRENIAIRRRAEAVRTFRASSKKEATRRKADSPTVFDQIRQPTREFVVVPMHTSETRQFIPFGFFSADNIIHNSCSAIMDVTPYHFGVLSSTMHMAWVRQVCGRLESRYRYSNKLVYNNYPWPESPTDTQKEAVEKAAQGVLDARAQFPDQTLADLYDPLAMPKALRDAHRALDRAVDRCYRPQPFDSDRQRVEYLFGLYEKLTTLFATTAKPARRQKRTGEPHP